ncbi:MAG: hypothetical protein IKY76_06395 [Alistipes sp.]|nr:hypothetical protein [Alistipes sp.]
MKNGNSIDLIGKIKECSKSWLLPYPFKIAGQAMLMAVLIGLVATIFINDLHGNGASTTIVTRIISITLYLAMFLLTFSREKCEDEMTAALRGETLKEIAYICFVAWVAIHIVAACITDYGLYISQDEPFVTPFVAWILYYGRFERKMRMLRRANREFKM